MPLPAESRQLPSGTMLDEKYRIDSLLAVGGMGEVYVGSHTKLRKRVAIKVLNRELMTPPMIERFHREAITASQIHHEGIAQVTDIGTSTAGEPFLVMELLDGESLGARMRATGPMSIDIACELTCAILAPLGAAHNAGIVHRDLKPDNVFLVRQSRAETVKLLDFGISRASGLESEFRLTTTGLVMGTPYYMSPEQARGLADTGPASDLYATGVILYEMLTGSVPISGDNYNQVMFRLSTGDFAPPRSLRPDLPVELEQVILAAMALEPANRPQSASDLERRLLPFCRASYHNHTIERSSSSFLERPPPHPGTPWPPSRPAAVTVPSSTGHAAHAASPILGTGTTRFPTRNVVLAIALIAIVAGGGATWVHMSSRPSVATDAEGTMTGGTVGEPQPTTQALTLPTQAATTPTLTPPTLAPTTQPPTPPTQRPTTQTPTTQTPQTPATQTTQTPAAQTTQTPTAQTTPTPTPTPTATPTAQTTQTPQPPTAQTPTTQTAQTPPKKTPTRDQATRRKSATRTKARDRDTSVPVKRIDTQSPYQ